MRLSHPSTPGHNGGWQHYLDLIGSSLAKAARGQEEAANLRDDGCSCYDSVIDKDLHVWRERGGVRWEEFQSVKDSAQIRATHYQVIDHQLYRQEDCMFGPRYGISCPTRECCSPGCMDLHSTSMLPFSGGGETYPTTNALY